MAIKVALVHDWLTNQGGGERVLWQLHELYPEAPIYTSVFNPDNMPKFADLNVRTSFLQHWPLAKRKHQLYPTLRTVAFESFDFSDYDLVVSSSSAEAKGVITAPGTLHISYLHTPTRYYWSGYHNYIAQPGFGPLSPLVKRVMPQIVSGLREWDFAAAQRPDHLLTNSNYVAARINKYYRREATVIHPPVTVERFKPAEHRGDDYVVVSRLIPYKQIELAIGACNRMKRTLVIAGDGSEMAKLRRLAGPTIMFAGRVSDEEVANLYAISKGFIFTAEEDFGITPLEAMASGCGVIAYGRGGALETIVEGETGTFFDEPSVDSLIEAIKRFEATDYNVKKLRAQAEKFSDQHFRRQFKAYVDKALKDSK